MFGKKKKMAAQLTEMENAQNTASQNPVEDEDLIYLDSELIDENELLESELLDEEETVALDNMQNMIDNMSDESDDQKQEEQPDEAKEESAEDGAEEETEENEEEEEAAEDDEDEDKVPVTPPAASAKEEQKEEIVYIVDGPEEDDEVVKPAKLVKLPHLVDYMISRNMSKPMKIRVATMLIATYNKFKDSPEDAKIVKTCLIKIMNDIRRSM